MDREFRSKPQPGDWTIPEAFAEHMDPIAKAILSEHEYMNVPIPYALQVVDAVGDDFKKVIEGNVDAAQPVLQKLNEASERYPDAPGWDRLRVQVISALFENGHLRKAFDAAWDISSPHQLLRCVFDIAEERYELLDEVDIAQRLTSLPPDRRWALTRALRDRVILKDLGEDQARVFNEQLRAEGLEEDPISGWIESQSPDYPEMDWHGVDVLIHDEGVWDGLSMYMRQHFIVLGLQMDVMLYEGSEQEEIREVVEGFTEWLDDRILEYPNILYWDLLCVRTGILLAKYDHKAAAQKVTERIREDQFKIAMAIEYLNNGCVDESIDMVLRVNDYHLGAEILLDTSWPDDTTGIKKLTEVMESDEYPVEQRIGFLEFIRDRFIEAELFSRADETQQKIIDLKDNS